MVDVFRSNLKNLLPRITSSIQKSICIAFDTEFTALGNAYSPRDRRLDTVEERYWNRAEHMSDVLILQIGLSMVIPCAQRSSDYSVETFTFYMFPGTAGRNERFFNCQASSLQFLTSCGFDFNKSFGDGVSFVNERQERDLKKTWEKTFTANSEGDVCAVERLKGSIGEWLKSSNLNDSMTVRRSEFNSYVQRKICFDSLKNAFGNAFVEETKEEDLLITHLTEQNVQIKKLEQERINVDLMKEMIGFKAVFDILRDSKVPIVGHNCFLDVLLFYNHFVAKCPKDLRQFSSYWSEFAGGIYDTKLISEKITPCLESELQFGMNDTSLQSLFLALQENAQEGHLGTFAKVHAPSEEYVEGGRAHDAGFDSFMTAYCFVQLKSLCEQLNEKMGRKLFFDSHSSILTPLEMSLTSGTESPIDLFKNKLRLGRCDYPCLDLGYKQDVPEREMVYCVHATFNDEKSLFKELFPMELTKRSSDFKWGPEREYILLQDKEGGADSLRQVLDILPSCMTYQTYSDFIANGLRYKYTLFHSLFNESKAFFTATSAFAAGVLTTLYLKKLF